MADISKLEKQLGVTFKNPALAELALVHSSYANENSALAAESNERLEFLGDAVLGFIVAEALYKKHPGMPEGEMTKLRAELVRRETLAILARRLGLGGQLYLGRGEEGSGGRDKPANLSRAMEAVIAAVYLDRGVTTARRVILHLLRSEMESTGTDSHGSNFKSRLQELTQERYGLTPYYEVTGESGPDHNKTFFVTVTVEERTWGKGGGKNKKIAEMAAARQALRRLKAEKL